MLAKLLLLDELFIIQTLFLKEPVVSKTYKFLSSGRQPILQQDILIHESNMPVNITNFEKKIILYTFTIYLHGVRGR